jgi:hypothetical protein
MDRERDEERVSRVASRMLHTETTAIRACIPPRSAMTIHPVPPSSSEPSGNVFVMHRTGSKIGLLRFAISQGVIKTWIFGSWRSE